MLLGSNVNVTMDQHFWAISAQGISGGADTTGVILMNNLLPTKAYADLIVVDGVSAYVARAAHDMHWGLHVHSIAQNNPASTIQHTLWYRDPPAAVTWDSWSMSALSITTSLKTGFNLLEVITNALAIGDSIRASAWGHYVPVGAIPEPTPVSVQEFHLFPKKKVSGPV